MVILNCVEIKKSYPVKRGYLREAAGVVHAVDGVSFSVEEGEAFGLVGESGCGKTTLGKIILGIVKPDSGTVEMSAGRPQVIFQDPFASLDPRMKVSGIIAEGLMVNRGLKGTRRGKKKGPGLAGWREEGPDAAIREAIGMVGLPESAMNRYPHQFSGGERQRIAIARAIISKPDFIVCDEPVSSLDVTVQLQILKLLKKIQKDFGITYLFISHDLRVIRYMCDRVAVMKDGKIVEEGKTLEVYEKAGNPYTKQLISSIPV